MAGDFLKTQYELTQLRCQKMFLEEQLRQLDLKKRVLEKTDQISILQTEKVNKIKYVISLDTIEFESDRIHTF